MIDVLELNGFLDGPTCEAIRAELGAVSGDAAPVYGGREGAGVEARMRRTTRLTPSPATCLRVEQRLMGRKAELERHFGVTLGACEPPQFLRYDVGDFFVAHQDGNTPLLRDDSRFRKVSVVVFLSVASEAPGPHAYAGGALVLHGPLSGRSLPVSFAPPPGTLLAFRAETTHEVTPVTRGERFTIVSWFR